MIKRERKMILEKYYDENNVENNELDEFSSNISWLRTASFTLLIIFSTLIILHLISLYNLANSNDLLLSSDDRIKAFAYCNHDAIDLISHGKYANPRDCNNILKARDIPILLDKMKSDNLRFISINTSELENRYYQYLRTDMIVKVYYGDDYYD